VTVCTETCPTGTFWTRGIQCIQPTPTANLTLATLCTQIGCMRAGVFTPYGG
jgi:hypothetical protein